MNNRFLRAFLSSFLVFSVVLTPFFVVAQTGTIVIRVPNLSNNTGKVMVALYKDGKNWLSLQTFRNAVEPIKNKSVEVTFADLPTGDYAISLFHDENTNRELDLNFMGIPTERFAFSNIEGMIYSKPAFNTCKFKISPNDKKVLVMKVVSLF